MHQNALDDTILLCLLSQRNQSLVWVVVVSLQHALHPAGSLGLHIVGNTVGKEALNLDATDSDMDDANLDVLRQRLHECTTKPVCWSQSIVRTAEGWYGLTPFTHFTGGTSVGSWEVNSGH